jgi:integrase/recombinase XerD
VPLDIADISLYLDNQSSPKTSTTYKWALERWFAFLGDREPSEQVALEFRKHLEDTLANRSAANVFNTIRKFYEWSGQENPLERLKAPKKLANYTPRVPEDSLVDKMLAMCDDTRDKAIILLLLNGLRASEVKDLTMSSLNWSEEYNNYILTVIGKGNRQRLLPIPEEVAWQALDYSQTQDSARQWLFVTSDGSKMTMRGVEYVVEKWSRLAGDEIRPHRLRHHFATRLVRSGVPIFVVQQLLGHVNVQSTQIYTHLDLSDLINGSRQDSRYQGGKDVSG